MSGPGFIVCLSCRGGCIGRIPGLAGVRMGWTPLRRRLPGQWSLLEE